MFRRCNTDTNKLKYYGLMIPFIGFMLFSLIANLMIDITPSIQLEGEMQDDNITTQFTNTLDMVKQSCYSDKTFIYYISDDCSIDIDSNIYYNNFLIKLHILQIVDYGILLITIFTFCLIQKNIQITMKCCTICIFFVFFFGLAFQTYQIASISNIDQFVSSHHVNITAQVFVADKHQRDISNIITINNYQSLAREICIAQRSNDDNPFLYAHAKINYCTYEEKHNFTFSTFFKILALCLAIIILLQACFEIQKPDEIFEILLSD